MSPICPTCHITQPCWGDHDDQNRRREQPSTPPERPSQAPAAPPRLRTTPTVAHPHDGERCAHQDPHRYVCRACSTAANELFHRLPDLMEDLDITFTKQARMAAAGPGTTNLPYAPLAAEALYVTRTTVLTWVDEIATIRGHHTPTTWAGIADYLRSANSWIAQHPRGWWIVDELTDALRLAERIIDRPADRVYVGRCGALIAVDGVADTCSQEVYARPGAPTAPCRKCGTAHDVTSRREAMLDHIWEEHLPAADLARAVNGILGTNTISTVTIRQWKRRGHIVPTGADDKGRPTYLVSDVVNRALGVTPEAAPMSDIDGKMKA